MSVVTESSKVQGKTPLMRQYYAVKERHPGTILLFRMGDFYETFEEDAEKVHSVLGITLTKRSSGAASKVSLAGFPYHALDTYLPKLVKAGFRVAICEQLEEPIKGKKIVDRDVVEIVTPGVSIRTQLLDPKQATYLVSVHLKEVGRGKQKRLQCGVSYADISTGEFTLAETLPANLETFLRGIGPSEILCERSLRDTIEGFGFGHELMTTLDDWVFGSEYAQQVLIEHFDVHSLKGFGIEDGSVGTTAAGALLHYLQETQKGSLPHIRRLEVYDESAFMPLDRQTLRNMELISNANSGGRDGSLVSILDETKTPMGARLLRTWLIRPLRRLPDIMERQAAVEAFHSSRSLREQVREHLSVVGDLERATVRISTGRASPRDLSGLGQTFSVLPEVVAVLSSSSHNSLQSMAERIDLCDDMRGLIENAIVDEPPVSLKDGGVIRTGYSSELDELRNMAKGGKEWLAELQQSEAQRTGITSLKVGFNRVFGYYLEVTNVHKDKVPEEYIRKQTLVNAERYITPELKLFEEKILSAEDKLVTLEANLFAAVREQIATHIDRIQSNARLLARVDVLANLAEVAVSRRFVKPLLNEGLDLEIEDGRHPVVEALLPLGEPFIPNSVKMSQDTEQILIITGPNMAGKSVVLRQVGLIVLLAQIGSFVPAAKARIGLVDRIFTRVGASDNLAAGESTFLVEMNETANILNNTSNRSLILLDEVGRGTSTFDGLSIAWALVEYLHTQPQVAARTLFATHYHELNELENRLERVRNFRIQVQEHNGRVIFLRKLVRGGADHSYGIEVARMAGLPADMLDRSRQILNQLEMQDLEVDRVDLVKDIGPGLASTDDTVQMSLFVAEADPRQQEVADILAALDPESMTPIDALLLLSRLHRKLNEA